MIKEESELKQKYYGIVFAFLMSIALGVPMNLIMSYMNAPPEAFQEAVLFGTPVAVLIAFPIALVAVPVIKRGLAHLVDEA